MLLVEGVPVTSGGLAPIAEVGLLVDVEPMFPGSQPGDVVSNAAFGFASFLHEGHDAGAHRPRLLGFLPGL